MARKRARKKRPASGAWVTYPRCFVLTLALIFIGLPSFIYFAEGHSFHEAPRWAKVLVGAMATGGVILLAVGMLGSRRDNEKLAESADVHELSLIIMILAAPLYLILKLFSGNFRR